MREIDNNKLNSVNFQGLPKFSAESNDTPYEPQIVTPQENPEGNNIDLAAMPSASLGKSQVNAPDTVESDMKFLEKNPALAKAITQAIDNYAENHTEDETLQMIEKCHQEFVK